MEPPPRKPLRGAKEVDRYAKIDKKYARFDASKQSIGRQMEDLEAHMAEQDRLKALPPVYGPIIEKISDERVDRMKIFLKTNASKMTMEREELEVQYQDMLDKMQEYRDGRNAENAENERNAQKAAANNGQPVAEEPEEPEEPVVRKPQSRTKGRVRRSQDMKILDASVPVPESSAITRRRTRSMGYDAELNSVEKASEDANVAINIDIDTDPAPPENPNDEGAGRARRTGKSSDSQRAPNADAPKSPAASSSSRNTRGGRTSSGIGGTSSGRASRRTSQDRYVEQEPVASRTRKSSRCEDPIESQPLQAKKGVKRNQELSEAAASIIASALADLRVRSSERVQTLQQAENIAESSEVAEPLYEYDPDLAAGSDAPNAFLDAPPRNQAPPAKLQKKDSKPKSAPRASGTSGSRPPSRPASPLPRPASRSATRPSSRPASRASSRHASPQASGNAEAEKLSRPSRTAKVQAQQKMSDAKKKDSSSKTTPPSKPATTLCRTLNFNYAPMDIALRSNAQLQLRRDQHYGVRASSIPDPTATFGETPEESRERELARNNGQHRRDDRHDDDDDGPQDPDPMGQAPRDQAPGDQAPRDQAPEDRDSPDQAPRDQAPSDQAPSDQAAEDQNPPDQAAEDRDSPDQAPGVQAPRDQGAEDQNPPDQAPVGQAPRDQAAEDRDPPDQADGASGQSTNRDNGRRNSTGSRGTSTGNQLPLYNSANAPRRGRGRPRKNPPVASTNPIAEVEEPVAEAPVEPVNPRRRSSRLNPLDNLDPADQELEQPRGIDDPQEYVEVVGLDAHFEDVQIEAAHGVQEEEPEDEEPDKNEPGSSTRNLRTRKRPIYSTVVIRKSNKISCAPPPIEDLGDSNREPPSRVIDDHKYHMNLVGEVTIDDESIMDEDCPLEDVDEDADCEEKEYVDEKPDEVIPNGLFPTRYSKFFKITRAAHELSDAHCLRYPNNPARSWVESMKEEEKKLRKLSENVSKVRDFPFSDTELDIIWDTTPKSQSAKDMWPTRHLQLHVFMAQEMIRRNRLDYEEGSLTAEWDDPMKFVRQIADQCESYVTFDARLETFQDPALVSLVDVIERNENTESLYEELAEKFPKTSADLKKFMNDIKQYHRFLNLLRKGSFSGAQILNHLIDMVHNKYMPRGGLYLKLLLNVAHHFQFRKAEDQWEMLVFEEKTLFKGVEFNFIGEPIVKRFVPNIHHRIEAARRSEPSGDTNNASSSHQ